MSEAAWAAAHLKHGDLRTQYWRLARRRGKKRAVLAMAHTILQAGWYILKWRRPYHDLGEDHFDRVGPERKTRRLVKELEKLGYKVILQVA